jgi:hypothetical protein
MFAGILFGVGSFFDRWGQFVAAAQVVQVFAKIKIVGHLISLFLCWCH